MQFTSAFIAALSALSFASASPGPANSDISCGCYSDCTIADAQAAIDMIDVTAADGTDPMNAIATHKDGALSTIYVMTQAGGCRTGAGETQNIGGPGGVGGGLTGTVLSGQDFHDVLQAMLDGCQDTDTGTVNGCATAGGGNVMLGKLGL